MTRYSVGGHAAAGRVPIAIEVVGPTGSGKSSVIRAILAGREDLYARASIRDRAGGLTFARHVVRAALPFVSQLPRIPSRPWYRFGIMVQLQSHANLISRWNSEHRVALLDQGPVYLLSILQRALRGDGRDSVLFLQYWEALLESWSRTLHVVIVLDAPNDILFERVQRRGTPHPLLGRPRSAMGTRFDRSRRSYRIVLDSLKRMNPSLRFFTVPVDKVTPGEIAEQVCGEVALLLEDSEK